MTAATEAIPSTYELPASVIDRLRPRDNLTVSQWCDRYRYLDSKFSAEPGRWDTSRVPYMREILDAFADPTVGSIVWMKCARVGGTEFLNNALAYSVDMRPMPIQYVLPKQSDVHDEFSGRIRGIFDCSEELSKHIPSGTWATAEQISLDTLSIYGGWASSPDTLIRRTIGVAIYDEIDNCQKQAGRLGNTWKILGERLATFGYRAKQIGVSSATDEDGTTWQLYQASDRRQYNMPCPHCGYFQLLKLASLKWPENRTPDEIELDALAQIVCGDCGSLIDQCYQQWMVERGLWVPACQQIVERLNVNDSDQVAAAAATENRWTPKLKGDPPRTRHRGYWSNSFVSPWRTWSQIAAEFLRVKDDPEKLRVFVNSWLGEPWQNAVEAPDESWLLPKLNAATHDEGEIPSAVRVMLGTADVQHDRIYYNLVGWGPQMQSWRIKHGEVATFEELYDIAFRQPLPMVHDPSRKMHCYALAVDARYRGDEVHEFAKLPGVAAMHGYERRTKPVERSNLAPRGAPEPRWVWNVHTTLLKSKLARLMKAELDGPNAWHLHRQTGEDYIKQVTAEHFVLMTDKKSGRKKWAWRLKSSGRPNHYFDTEVGQIALIEILRELGELDVAGLTTESRRLCVIEPPKPDDQKAAAQKPRRKRVTGGWVRR
ncbi:hypothetical protein HED60_14940 [Planctomycetales bacterium ZRK34]|nr:hypothetical protein HED60_14940 [Planctomycetales bacterium ZRK34]